MPNNTAIAWFKQNFGTEIEVATKSTPFDVDMLTAIACQETGFIWGQLSASELPRQRIVELCVGDTLDRARTFPRNRADLEAWPRGDEMFAIARAALIELAGYVEDFKPAARNPDKFCKGYGLFQYDLQYFKVDPDYFLERRYARFDQTLAHCLGVLNGSLDLLGWRGKPRLSDLEKAAVAIAYNTGGYQPALGLKQGHKNGQGKYYGELFFDYLQLAKSVPTPARLRDYRVKTAGAMLNVRSAASPSARVIAQLPNRHPLKIFPDAAVNGFLHIQARLAGRAIDGWGSATYLIRA
jgi:hypothetical protein